MMQSVAGLQTAFKVAYSLLKNAPEDNSRRPNADRIKIDISGNTLVGSPLLSNKFGDAAGEW